MNEEFKAMVGEGRLRIDFDPRVWGQLEPTEFEIRANGPVFKGDFGGPKYCSNLMIHAGAESVEKCKEAESWEIEFFMKQIRKPGGTPVHYQHGVNTPACLMGGDVEIWDVDGEWIIEDRTMVTCKMCIEWLHA